MHRNPPYHRVRNLAPWLSPLALLAVTACEEPTPEVEEPTTEIEDVAHATTIGGSSEVGVPVTPDEMEPIDLIVSGSVAVNGDGARVGKGEGYSDLEFAILREFGLVDDETTTVTTLHEMQFVDREIPTTRHDVPIEWAVTPERAVRTAASDRKPAGIAWNEVTDGRLEEIPILKRLRNE